MICNATSGVYKNPIYSLFSWLDEYVPVPLLLITTALMLFLTSGPPVFFFFFTLQEGPAHS